MNWCRICRSEKYQAVRALVLGEGGEAGKPLTAEAEKLPGVRAAATYKNTAKRLLLRQTQRKNVRSDKKKEKE